MAVVARTASRPVPADEILALETRTLETMSHRCPPLGTAQWLQKRYEAQAASILGHALKGRTGIGENELFARLSSFFYDISGATTGGVPMSLSYSVMERTYNCQTSTILMADIMTRLGMEVKVIWTPGHVLLRGRDYAFETTSKASPAIDVARLSSRYPVRMESGPGSLIADTHRWAASMMLRAGMPSCALDICNEALMISPNDVIAINAKACALLRTGKHEEAMRCIDTAMGIEMDHPLLWGSRGLISEAQGDRHEAHACYEKALALAEHPVGSCVLIDMGALVTDLRYRESVLRRSGAAAH